MRVNLLGFTTLLKSCLNDNAHLYQMTCGKFKKLKDDLFMILVESTRRGEMESDSEIMDSITVYPL